MKIAKKCPEIGKKASIYTKNGQKSDIRPWVLAAIFILFSCRAVSLYGEEPAPEVFLFSYFMGNGDGLHWARSDDGLNWSAVGGGKSFLAPVVGENKLMRDPCVLRGPDGVFRMVWTTSWSGHTIGYASSPDLLHWSAEKAIPVMADEPTAENCWAPEVIHDPVHQDYLIFWATSIPGRFPGTDHTGHVGSDHHELDHRIYATTTRDFVTFTPTRLLYDPGFDVIDATMARGDDGWLLFVKNETERPARQKHPARARANTRGPFCAAVAPDHGRLLGGGADLDPDRRGLVRLLRQVPGQEIRGGALARPHPLGRPQRPAAPARGHPPRHGDPRSARAGGRPAMIRG
jgi:hypothetical protein